MRDLAAIETVPLAREGAVFEQPAIARNCAVFTELKKLAALCFQAHVVTLRPGEEEAGEGKNGIGNVARFDLGHHTLEHPRIGHEADRERRQPGMGGQFRARLFVWPWAFCFAMALTFAFVAARPVVFATRRARITVAPFATTRAGSRPAGCGRETGIVAGEIGVPILVRRLFDPSRQKF